MGWRAFATRIAGPGAFAQGRASLLIDVVLCAALTLLALGARCQAAHLAHGIFDNLDPYHRAFMLLERWQEARGAGGLGLRALWPDIPPDESQFGPALVWLYVPFVAGASSLCGAVARRLALQVVMIPLTYVTLRWLLGSTHPRWDDETTPARRAAARVGALVGASMVGFSGHPFGALDITYADLTYLAPDLCAWVAVALLIGALTRATAWTAIACGLLPVAAMTHPMALCYLPGIAIVLVLTARRGAYVAVGWSLGIGAVMSIPLLGHLWSVARTSAGGGAAVVDLALGESGEVPSRLGVIGNAVEGFAALEPFPLGWWMLLSVVAPLVLLAAGGARQPRGPKAGPSGGELCSRIRVASTGAAVVVASLLGLGVLIWHLDGYHLRLVLPVLGVQSGILAFLLVWALLRRPWLHRHPAWGRGVQAAIVVGVLLCCVEVLDGRGKRYGDLDVFRWAAAAIADDAGDRERWVEIFVEPQSNVSHEYSPAIYIEQRLMGVPRAAFGTDGVFYLLVVGSERVAIAREWPGATPVAGWTVGGGIHAEVLRFDEPGDSILWTGQLVERYPDATLRLNAADYLSPGAPEEGLDAVRPWLDSRLDIR